MALLDLFSFDFTGLCISHEDGELVAEEIFLVVGRIVGLSDGMLDESVI
jgi:hypothetical protein